MRILVVASFNKGHFAPFIVEQADSLRRQGCEVDFFGLQGKGLQGYLYNLPKLKQRIKAYKPDVIHAHYGLSGLLANLQRKVPVVTTYHGSDINDKKVLPFSKLAMRLSAWNVFVSQKALNLVQPKKKYSLLPCGIDFSDAQLTHRKEARQKMGLSQDKCYILFAGAFDNAVKNAPLAKEVVSLLQDANVEMIELKGFSREEVTLLMCGVDAFLMTSNSEGSPQVIKEAMACGCPIVSVDVGDVQERIKNLDGCYVSQTRNPSEIAVLLKRAMAFEGKTQGRKRISVDELENKQVARKLKRILEENK